MKRLMLLSGVLLVMVGVTWILQGIGLLGGNPMMTGHVAWAAYGGLAVLAGAGAVLLAQRRR